MCPGEDAGEVNPVGITDSGQEIKQVSKIKKKKKLAVRLQQGSNPTTHKRKVS